MTEQEIVAGCLRRQRDAQRALYTQTADRIYALLMKLTRNAEDAADLLQDTFIRAFERIEQFQGGSSLSTWIYRIAVNEAQQHFRRTKRHDEILREEVPPPQKLQKSEEAATSMRIDVSAALAKMPDEERTLIVLRYYQDMDYSLMAEVLEKPVGTIASGLNRARRMLEKLLKYAADA